MVPRVEQTLAACLTLAPRQGTKAVEAARDRRDEAPLVAAVGRYRTEQRLGRLIRAMGAGENLDGRVNATTGVHHEDGAARSREECVGGKAVGSSTRSTGPT